MKHLFAFALVLLFAVASHAQTPVFQWAESISNVAFMYSAGCTDVAVAANGAVYVNGVNGSPAYPDGSSVIEDEVIDGPILARYDASGDMIWVRPGGWALTTVGSNDIYVTGDFHGARNFGGTSLIADSVDAFLARYDANGNVIWARQMGGATRDKGIDVAVDASGQVHVAGFFTGSATFGTTTLIATHDSTGFIATYDSNGNFIRAFIAGGTDNAAYNVGYRVDLACDATGRTYLFSMFDGTASFNGTNLTSAGTNAMALARFESNGTCAWARQMGGTRNISAGLAVAASGNVYTCGTFDNAGTFGTINIANSLTADDAFLALYDPNGDPIWAQRIVTSMSAEYMMSVAVNSLGNAVISGHSSGPSATICGTTITGIAGQVSYVAEFDATGSCQWGEQLCTSWPYIALGATDDLYLAGSDLFIGFGPSSTIFDFDTGTGIQGNVPGHNDGFLAHYSAVRDFQWIRLMGSTQLAFDAGNGIVTDAAGNVYTAGGFSRSAILCADTVKAFTSTSCIFLSKRDGNGDCTWTNSVCTDGSSSANAIAMDGNGDLYITGSFSGTAEFGVAQLVSASTSDAFLAKYDTNGNCLWAKNVGGPGYAYAVAVNASGAVAVAGTCTGTATIGTTTFTGTGNADGFLARYDASGAFIWAKSMGGSGFDNLPGLTMDAAGNAYVTGSFVSSADFSTLTITGTGTSDMFLAKYDTNGDPVWAQSMEGTGSKTGTALVINNTGNIHVTGYYNGSIDLGTTTFSGSPGNTSVFLSSYDPAGTNLWAVELPTIGGTSASALAARPGGDLVLAGQLFGTATVGGTTLTSVGAYGDVLLAAFDASGQPLWAGNWGGGAEDGATANGVAADAHFVYATGYFGNSSFDLTSSGGGIDFAPGDPDAVLYAPNSLDAFVVKYAVDESVSIAEASAASIDLVIAPNPVERCFTIANTTAFDPRTRVVVHDALGRAMIAPFSVKQNSIEVDATALTPGAYTVTLFTSAGTLTRRFAKH